MTPTELGVHHSVLSNDEKRILRRERRIAHASKERPVEALSSTSKAVWDKWSIKGSRHWTDGGGNQYYIPKSQHGLFV